MKNSDYVLSIEVPQLRQRDFSLFTLHSSLFTLHFLMSYASNPARNAARPVRSDTDNGGILRTAHWSH